MNWIGCDFLTNPLYRLYKGIHILYPILLIAVSTVIIVVRKRFLLYGSINVYRKVALFLVMYND